MKAKRKPVTKAKPKKAPNAPTPEFYINLGAAFREQEDSIGDLLTMAEITARSSVDGDADERIFTAHHLRDMIEDFRKRWYDTHKTAQSKAA